MVLRPDFDSAGPDDLQLSLPADMSSMPWLLMSTEQVIFFHSVAFVVVVFLSDTFYKSGFLQTTWSE